MSLGRLRPTRNTLAALVALLWAISFGAVRDFVWEDLRAGMVRLEGLNPAVRLLVRLGFAMLVLMLGVLLLSDFWRAQFPLLAATAGTPGRGSLIPTLLVPTTLFLLALAWSYVLTGALHSAWPIRLGVLGGYLIFGMVWTRASLVSTNLPAPVLLNWSLILLTPLFFLVRWRARPRPAGEFLILFVLVAGAGILVHSRLINIWQGSGVPLFLAILDNNMVSLVGLALPLLYLIGLDIADFVFRLSNWSAAIANARLGRWGLPLLTGGLLFWRLADALREVRGDLADLGAGGVFWSYGGALGVPAAALLAWQLVRWTGRRNRADDTGVDLDGIQAAAAGAGPWVIVAFLGANVVFITLATLILGVGSTLDGLRVVTDFTDRLSAVYQESYFFVIMAGAAVAALVLGLRGRRNSALYLWTLSLTLAWGYASSPAGPLQAFYWPGNQTSFWWVVLVTGFLIWWWVAGRLTRERQAGALIILLVLTLLRQTDFIENPFSPIFGFAGIAFIAFGLLWDALTVGSWANQDTRRLPRTGRIFLYLGYVLFTVTLVNWMLTAHNIVYVDTFTGEAAMAGLKLVGLPMLQSLFVLLLLANGAPLPAPGDDHPVVQPSLDILDGDNDSSNQTVLGDETP